MKEKLMNKTEAKLRDMIEQGIVPSEEEVIEIFSMYFDVADYRSLGGVQPEVEFFAENVRDCILRAVKLHKRNRSYESLIDHIDTCLDEMVEENATNKDIAVFGEKYQAELSNFEKEAERALDKRQREREEMNKHLTYDPNLFPTKVDFIETAGKEKYIAIAKTLFQKSVSNTVRTYLILKKEMLSNSLLKKSFDRALDWEFIGRSEVDFVDEVDDVCDKHNLNNVCGEMLYEMMQDPAYGKFVTNEINRLGEDNISPNIVKEWYGNYLIMKNEENSDQSGK